MLRPRLVLVLALWTAAGVSCKRVAASRDPLALPEDSYGVAGAPRDESRFDFDVDAEPSPQPPRLEGGARVDEATVVRLAPYLASRRVHLVGTAPGGTGFLVVARLGATAQAAVIESPLGPLTQVTFERDPIAQVVAHRGALLYRVGRDGDERHQIIRFDPSARTRTLLTDGESRHGPFTIARSGGALAYASHARGSAEMLLRVGDGLSHRNARTLAARDGVWVVGSWSPVGRWFLAREYRSNLHSRLHLVDSDTGEIVEAVPGEPATFRGGTFSADGEKLYFMTDRGRDFLALWELDLRRNLATPMTADIPWDVELASASGDRLAFTTNEDGLDVVYVVELRTGRRQRLDGIPSGVIRTLWLREEGRELALEIATPTAPGDLHTYDVDASRLVRWTNSELATAVVTPEPFRYSSFDGTVIRAFLFRPPGVGPFPVVLWLHGGPEAQFRPDFHPFIQYLAASAGIAVVAPNVRGSTGYGRRFQSLDDGRRRTDAVADLGALLDWIEARPDLDGKRVAIHGGSYGGYLVLAALVEFGDRLVAGSDYVGISDFVTFLEGTAAFRQEHRRAEYGDERDPDMKTFLREISPRTHAARIRRPLFVAHGANDPRVPVAEAKQIVDAVRQYGVDAWLMIAHDEGHGFRRRPTRDLYYGLLATFLERHLAPTRQGR